MLKLLTTTAAIGALGIASANAAAVYSSDASTVLTVMSVTNQTNADNGTSEMFLDGSAEILTNDTETDGDAMASANWTLDPDMVVDRIFEGGMVSNIASVGGSAEDGSAETLLETNGFLSLQNASLEDSFLVTIGLTYDLAVSATVDDLGAGEFATAEAYAFVESRTNLDGLGEVIFDTVLDLAITVEAGGVASDSRSATLMLEFLVQPGGFVDMQMFADALGSATGMAADMDPDVVPLPGALGFMVVGLAGAAAARRRAAA